MKEIIEAIDLVLDALRKNDTSFAALSLVLLKAKLIARKEDVKVSRQMGAKKRELIDAIKKLKL